MSLDMRLMAYQPNGDLIGPLPACQRIQAMFSRTELGAIEFDYGRTAPLASTLDGDIEVAVEVSSNGSPYIEVTDGRFLILGSANDDAKKTDGIATLTGPSYGFRLAKAVVTKGNGTLKEGRRYFAPGSTAGGIMSILMSEAKSRGALEGVSFGSFSGTLDSDGKPWALGTSISYDPGLDLLAVVFNLVEQGMCVMRWVGREMFLYNADFGKDKTAIEPPLVLRLGRDIFEAPERTDGTQQATVAYAKGDEGKLISASSAANPAPWGRWETTVNQGGVSNDETLSYLAQRTLEMSKGTKREAGRGMVFAEGSPLPFIDYAHSDWIYSDTGSGLERLRVHQITLMRDEDGVATGSILLNDAIRELDIAIARRVNGILGGATAGGGSPAVPLPETDSTVPKAVTGLTIDSDAYLESGVPKAVMTVSWVAPVQNTDGTDLMDFQDYEVVVKDVAANRTQPPRYTSLSTLMLGGLEVGKDFQITVRVRDIYGHISAALSGTHKTAKDTTPPSVPSLPVVKASLGVATATWDGLSASGNAMESDFSHIEIHRSTVTGYTPSASTLGGTLLDAGSMSFTGQAYGVPWYYRFISVDKSGNKSAATPEVAIQTTPLVSGDLAQKVIEAGHIKSNQIEVDHLKAGFFEGIVIQGATVRTAGSGPRMEMSASGDWKWLYAYTGNPNEWEPAGLSASSNGISLSAPAIGSAPPPEQSSPGQGYTITHPYLYMGKQLSGTYKDRPLTETSSYGSDTFSAVAEDHVNISAPDGSLTIGREWSNGAFYGDAGTTIEGLPVTIKGYTNRAGWPSLIRADESGVSVASSSKTDAGGKYIPDIAELKLTDTGLTFDHNGVRVIDAKANSVKLGGIEFATRSYTLESSDVTAPFQNRSGYTNTIEREGNLVTVSWQFSTTASIASGALVTSALPTWARPSVTRTLMWAGSVTPNANQIPNAEFRSDGTVRLFDGSFSGSASAIKVFGTYHV